MTGVEEGIYLFCFARQEVLPDVGPGLNGGSPVSVWAFRDVAAVLSRVPLEDFCGTSGEAHLQDLTWVGPRACRHQEVIERVMRHSPVFPARFGTLFSSLERLERLMETHYDTVRAFLDRAADREEWGVKGLLDEAEAERRLLPPLSEASASSPGVRYLLERRRQAEADRQLKSWMDYLRGGGKYRRTRPSRPHLILLDLRMPKKDGLEALGEIRSDPELRPIPIVVLTTSRSEEDVQNSYALGANTYITKPDEFEMLVDALKTLEKYWFEVALLPGVEGRDERPPTS